MRCSISLDLNLFNHLNAISLGNQCLSILSENRCIATAIVFLSGMGVYVALSCSVIRPYEVN